MDRRRTAIGELEAVVRGLSVELHELERHVQGKLRRRKDASVLTCTVQSCGGTRRSGGMRSGTRR